MTISVTKCSACEKEHKDFEVKRPDKTCTVYCDGYFVCPNTKINVYIIMNGCSNSTLDIECYGERLND